MPFWTQAAPVLLVLSSLIPGLIIFSLREDQHWQRTFFNLLGVTVKLVLVGLIIVGVSDGLYFEFRLPFLPGAPLVLQADALSLQFVALSSILWFATTIYAIGYLEHSPLRSRFFGYFSLCVSTTVGVALAGNLVTFLLFYELLTLATFPLVVHRGTPEALRAGRRYLAYTISGGALVLLGTAILNALSTTPDFIPGGYVLGIVEEHRAALILAFTLLIGGMAVKAALVPLHGWLPAAMVAPAPVSALLHAVAVVKAGAFGIIRVVYDVYGTTATTELGLAEPLMWLAAFTILFGSLRALQQQEIKKRLAYSTVSQVAYITLGVALMGPIAAVAALVHLVHQGMMKITLFFCAGNFAETLGVHTVQEMNGIGRRMPWTMAAFTVGALGMIGAPPVAGFISKWYLAAGGLEVEQDWVVALLVISALLNAGYFLPLVYRGWFGLPPTRWPASGPAAKSRWETHWMLLFPPLFTALLSLLMGIFANTALSPLGWSRFIVSGEFAP